MDLEFFALILKHCLELLCRTMSVEVSAVQPPLLGMQLHLTGKGAAIAGWLTMGQTHSKLGLTFPEP